MDLTDIETVFLLIIALIVPVVYIVGGIMMRGIVPKIVLSQSSYVTDEDRVHEEQRKRSHLKMANYLILLGIFLMIEVPLIYQALEPYFDKYILTMLLVAESVALILLPVAAIRIGARLKR